MTRFTVLLPIVRPPLFLPFAIESVLDQSISDFELFVICDGAPPETAACAQEYARRDARVKVRAFPKGERYGEAHRHQVLAGASGRYVAHVADDDLWLPNHLEEMEALLSTVDFGHLLHVYVRTNGRVEILPGDLGSPGTRRRMLSEKFNLFGPTFAGYRLDAYRRLPEGWAPAPPDTWIDLHMWRKFLRVDGLGFATRAAVTAIHFAAAERTDFMPEQRREEIQRYWTQIRDPRGRNEIVQAAWRSLLDRTLQREDEMLALTAAQGELTSAHHAVQTELGRMTGVRDELQAELGRVTGVRDELQAELGRVIGVRDELQAELGHMTGARDELQADLARMTRTRDELRGEVGRVTADRDEAHVALRRMTGARDELRAELLHMTMAGVALDAQLAGTAKSLVTTEGELGRVLRSRSWRITAPLRRIGAFARRQIPR